MKYLRFLANNLWPILSCVTSVYFLWVFHKHVGFPPSKPLTGTPVLYLALFVVFLLAPFVQRLKLGRLIEFEAKVEEVRSDMKEVRTETRELISTVSAVATAISASVNQSVVVNVPNAEWARAAREEMSAAFGQDPEAERHGGDVQEYVDLSGSDLNYALARLRMDLERELRRIVGADEPTDDPKRPRERPLTARPLFRKLESAKPRYQKMRSSFDYVLEVCNAAIHGQRIAEGAADEAISMGLYVLRELKREQA